MGQDKDGLISEEKSHSMCKQSIIRHSFATSDQQADVYCYLESKASVSMMVTWEDKCH